MPEETAKPRMLLINPSVVPPGYFRYIQAETGKTFSFNNFNRMKEEVAAHRRANNIPIGTDFSAELQDWMCRRMPDAGMHCHEQGRSPQPSHNAGPMVGTGYQGQEKWRELHVWALMDDGTKYDRGAWLANFAASLPCGECRREWRQLTRKFPAPTEKGNTDLFAWSVEAHNRVNAKLGKRTLSTEEARAIYQ